MQSLGVTISEVLVSFLKKQLVMMHLILFLKPFLQLLKSSDHQMYALVVA